MIGRWIGEGITAGNYSVAFGLWGAYDLTIVWHLFSFVFVFVFLLCFVFILYSWILLSFVIPIVGR